MISDTLLVKQVDKKDMQMWVDKKDMQMWTNINAAGGTDAPKEWVMRGTFLTE